MNKFITLLIVSAVLCTATVQAHEGAEVPKGFGVGVETGQSLGVVPFYTLSSMFQLGLGVGMQLQSNNNVFLLSPMARFMLNLHMASMYLFLDGQLIFGFQDPENYIAFKLRVGLMSMILARVALYGGISFLDFQFDPTSVTTLGLLAPFIGVQWTPELD